MKQVVVILLSALILTGKLFSQTAPETEILEFGKPVEKRLAPQEKHFYKVRLEAGEFVKIEVAPKDCDVAPAIYALDEKHILDGKNEAKKNGIEIVSAAVKESGEYKIRVISADKDGAPGIYQIKISEKRAATEEEFAYSAGKLIMSKMELLIKADATADNLKFALSEFGKAIEFFRLANALKPLGVALDNSGIIYSRLGNPRKSLEFNLRSLEVFRTLGDKKQQSLALNSIGRTYSVLGEREKAIEILTEAVNLAREVKNRRSEAVALNGIGAVYFRLKNYDKAEIFYSQALPIFQEENDVYNQSITLNYLGNVYSQKNLFDKAIESYQKAIELEKNLTNRQSNASFLNNLGIVYTNKGEFQKALEYINQALELSVKRNDKANRAFYVSSVGNLYFKLGKLEEAEANLEKSLEIYRSIESITRLADVLYNLSTVENRLGKIEEARLHIEEAVKLIEELGSQINSGEPGNFSAETFYDFYTLYAEILLKRHKTEPNKNFDKLAWSAFESGRARNLLRLLNESNADIYEGVDKELIAKEREIYGLLNSRLENLTRVLSGKNSPEDVKKMREEIEKIRLDYQIVKSKIREKSPRYAALIQPKTLDVDQTAQMLPDANTVLLSYSLGEEKSFLWLVSKNEYKIFELPKRELIEDKTRLAYELLTARNKKIKFETTEEKAERIAKADAELPQILSELGEILLKPVGNLPENKRLLIIPDGILQYLPFSVLRTSERYLAETNEIVNLPSASALNYLQRGKQTRKIAPKTIAVFADPVFEESDERFAISKKSKLGNELSVRSISFEDLNRSMRDASGEQFNISRLPYTRKEAEAVTKAIAADKRDIALDFAATRQLALSEKLNQYQIIHFATHGFLNSKNPELSGLVLSLIDENGKNLDGFLRADEIFNMKLSADLVVLSGCKTGLGKDVRGEGLIGMTRGFMYAGASRVMVSLWDINDLATSRLMENFYENLLVKKLAPAQALRKAQIALINDKKYSNPYFWSSFVIQGQP